MSDTVLHTLQHADGAARADYEAALTSAAVFDASAHGRLWMHDRDRASLLQRLSTNDIEKLRPGQGTQTVLTNHNGRIIDLLTVHALEDRLLLVTSPQQRGAVRGLLRKNIFFNDKVKLEDGSQEWGQLHLYGPHSAELLQTLTGEPVDMLPLHGIGTTRIGAAEVVIGRIKPIGGAGFAIYAPAAHLPTVSSDLVAAGAHILSAATHDILRVEAGYGAYGHELSLEYIPLEAGLLDAISFTKGCYVGQEIIARMESRGRMAKQLRGLKLSEIPVIAAATNDDGQPVVPTPLARLSVNNKESGDLTSVALSPRFGAIALAYVRTAHAAPGTVVGIAGSDATATVVELPFRA